MKKAKGNKRDFHFGTLSHQFFYRLATFIILLAAGVGLYYFYLLFFPPRVTDLTNIQVSPKVVHAGQTLVVEADYCKKVDAVSVLIRDFSQVGGQNVVIPLTRVASTDPVGCGKFVNYVMIPTKLPKGTYRVDLTFEYQANPIRTVYEEFKSPMFEIN